MRRIGVLTGGGDCPGLNAVIRAVVKSAIYEHGIEVTGILDGYQGLLEGWSRPLSDGDVSDILSKGGTILGTNNRVNPFKFAVKEKDGKVRFEDRSKQVLDQIKKLGLDGLVVIGGDGTLASAHALSKLGVPIVGVPKTIDNDLRGTDVTFGFDSALAVATDAVDRLHTTAESHHRAMILEVMGRYAGWIALRSGMAGGGDVILIPEIPYDIGKVCEFIKYRLGRGKRFSIVVVAEGAMPAGGSLTVKDTVEGSADPIRLGGVGQVIGRQIGLCSGLETRVAVLGHLQRGGTPTPFDRWLSTRFGASAVRFLTEGKTGRMVALRGASIESADLAEVARGPRLVDPESEEVLAARAVGTYFGN